MAAYDDKMAGLREAAERAAERAGGISESEWPDAESRARLNEILTYARLVIAGSDGALVSDSAGSNLQATLGELADSPERVAPDFAQWVERILDQLSRLPLAQGHDFERRAKDAAKTFQRSAQQRLGNLSAEAHSIEQQVIGTRERLDEIRAEMKAASDQRLDELAGSIAEMRTAFEGRLQQYESNLETERAEGLKLRGDQAETFQKAQAERADEARQLIGSLETELKQRSAEAIAGLERSREQVASLVDLVTTSTTSGGFGTEANRQKTEGDKWRLRAVIFGLLATGVAVFAVIYAVSVEVKTSLIIAKTAVVVTLVGLAGYAAKQSAEHRGREVRARRLELELTAFGPFTEALRDEEKEREARLAFIDRIFVGEQGLLEKSDTSAALTSGDVSLLGQLIDVLRKATK
jgi:VIT1/CCC1 family predicted Fe2+/Mn2+ transporter